MTNYPNLAYLANDPHWVYVVWNGDTPVYAGMTSDWRARTSVHVKDYLDTGRATHIDAWQVCDNRDDAERIEIDTIRALDPADNRQHSPSAEARRAAWLAYSEWGDAWYHALSDPSCEWAHDPDTAARICRAVGREAPAMTLDELRADFHEAATRTLRHL
jgi:predicted GIY-YIG superfamily endonuclease